MLSQLQHRRTHNLLLFSKLLNCRDNGSPFTLVIDSLEQSARPLLLEMIRRAKVSKAKIIYISFETLRQLRDTDVFIVANEPGPAALQKEILLKIDSSRKNLLIFDTLHPLLYQSNINIASFLSSFPSPHTSLLTVFHSDIPLVPNTLSHRPSPKVLLQYLATTILTVHSLSHILARKAAADRSLPAPVFGLDEDIEGVLVGLGSNDPRGTVVEMEYRRKSGRGIREWFSLPSQTRTPPTATINAKGFGGVILLEDHPLYSSSRDREAGGAADGEKDLVVDTTFNLSLTAKQLKDREGVVLPYFDAQSGAGPGEGGRILYDMGVEDDFDEEEDEI